MTAPHSIASATRYGGLSAPKSRQRYRLVGSATAIFPLNKGTSSVAIFASRIAAASLQA
jgi:hypothetical protein